MSIRLRLTIWHAGVFFISLLGFALVIWLGTRQVIRSDIDTWLLRQADGLEEFLKKETHGTGQAAVAEETREFSTGLPRGSGVQLLDPRGNVLFARPEIGLDGVTEQPSTSIFENVSVRAVKRTVAIAGEDFQIALWRSMDAANTALEDLGMVLLLMVPAFLLFSAAGGWFLSGRAFRPVDEITRAARQIGLQDLSKTLPVPRPPDELQRLTIAWNEMLGRLDSSTRQLRQFTADVSHELRSPVSVIRTTAELALRQDRSLGEYYSSMETIRDESVALTGVIENLLELARADSGPVLSLARLDLRDLLLEIQPHAESMANYAKLDLRFALPPNPVFVLGDRSALRRLFLLLIDNAIKFTPPPGHVEMRMAANSNEIVLEVEDSGIGISLQDLPRVFDRFYQVDRSRSGGGVGLGLSIVRWIVQDHGGQIEALSEPNRGSLFRVTLPLATEFQDQEAVRAEQG